MIKLGKVPKQKTERTFNGAAIHWFSQLLESDGYSFKKAENDVGIQTFEGIRYPDALFWVVPGSFPAGTLIELKPPTTPVTDREMLHTSVLEARGAGIKYFATWNMRETIIWKVPSNHLEILDKDKVKVYPPLTAITSEKDLDDPNKVKILKERAQELLQDLSQLCRKDKIAKSELDSTFFVNLLVRTVHDIAPIISQEIQKQYFTNKSFKNEFRKWAVSQGIENFEDLEFFETVGRQSVYRLLVKVLFYQALSRRFEGLPVSDPSNPKRLQEDLQACFELVRNIDYEPIYEPDFPDKVKIPEFAAMALIDLINKLHEFDFSLLPRDVIGRVFEQLIPHEERRSLGQYFTNALLVDFINSFTIRTKNDNVLDPACGTGTFLTRAYHHIIDLAGRGHSGIPPHRQLLLQLWGTDIASFPATLAMINLAAQNLEDRNNFPLIFARDFFDFRKGEKVEIPEPRITNQAFKKKINLPKFEAIVANPPYIRQEKIEKYIKGYKEFINSALLADWGMNSPRFSGQADIYVFFFAHAANLLSSKGRLGFVTSNSWLDVGYGYELQKFFLNQFKIIAICESRTEPWFEDAAVNTVVTILERCDDRKKRNENIVRFVKIKKKLKNLIPFDDKTQSVDRFLAFDKLTNKIELTKNDSEDESLRIRTFRQEKIKELLEKEQKTAKWGIYLRAPDIYFKIQKLRKKIVPLSELADTPRGVTTNKTDFFFLTDEDVRQHEIENEYLLKPIIYTPKEVPNIEIDKSKLKFSLLYCKENKNNLRGTNVLKYIRDGEKRGYHKTKSFKGDSNWYILREVDTTPCSVFYARQGDVFRVVWNPEGIVVNDNLYRIIAKRKKDSELIAALLNSTLFALGLEINGRVNLGDGALKIQAYELGMTPIVNPKILTSQQKREILNVFKKMRKRKTKKIKEEVMLKDRQRLDKIIFKSLGLNDSDLTNLYKGVTGLVKERLELAKQRKKIRQKRTQRDLSKVVDSIEEEVFPNGIRKFPDAFIAHLPKKDLKTINLPRRKLKLGEHFFGKYKLTIDDKPVMEAHSVDEAEYILLAQKEGITEYKIPIDEKDLGKIVASYKKYLREKHDQLTEAALNRGLSIKDVEDLSRQIWGELPKF